MKISMLTEIEGFGIEGDPYWCKGQTFCLVEIGPVLGSA